MSKWKKNTKIAVFIIFLILAVLFAALCWKKRRGIYNTYMKLTGQEILSLIHISEPTRP